jgi:hypothetical protein
MHGMRASPANVAGGLLRAASISTRRTESALGSGSARCTPRDAARAVALGAARSRVGGLIGAAAGAQTRGDRLLQPPPANRAAAVLAPVDCVARGQEDGPLSCRTLRVGS